MAGASVMKEAVLAVLQQRMDGCARDQFWAVAVVSGLNAFLAIQAPRVLALLPRYFLVTAVLLAGAYAIYYIIDRHRSYYGYRAELAELVAGEEWCPRWMRSPPKASSVKTWIGSGFYLLWVVGATVTGVLASWQT